MLTELFAAACEAVAPERCVPPHLPAPPGGRTVVVGAGKAAAAMARAVENSWPGPLEGLVVTRYGHGVPCEQIEVVEAAHPVPDAAGLAAATRILETVRGLSADDLVLCLLSGGGSALLTCPSPGLSIEDKQQITKRLLVSGADIAAINCVRKHMSAIKGGQLAVACQPARVVTLMISDVPGDDPSVIASGPTVGDPTTARDALDVLERYGIDAPRSLRDLLAQHETPAPGDPRLARSEPVVVGSSDMMLAAAARAAERRGFRVLNLGDASRDAEVLANEHAAGARALAREGQPAIALSGGETTVTVRGGGRGGRNSQYALALARSLDGLPGVHAIACDTDGIDGTEDNAGCLVAPDTLTRAAALGLDAAAHLVDNDAYSFFAALDDLVVTGPTRTNVNDFRAILFEG